MAEQTESNSLQELRSEVKKLREELNTLKQEVFLLQVATTPFRNPSPYDASAKRRR